VGLDVLSAAATRRATAGGAEARAQADRTAVRAAPARLVRSGARARQAVPVWGESAGCADARVHAGCATEYFTEKNIKTVFDTIAACWPSLRGCSASFIEHLTAVQKGREVWSIEVSDLSQVFSENKVGE